MSGELTPQNIEAPIDEHEDVVQSLEHALSIVKANSLSREQALGVVTKLLQPISPNSF